MVKRLVILLIPCFLGAVLLANVAWQRFDLDQTRQDVQELEQVLGVDDAQPLTESSPVPDYSESIVTRVIDGDTVELQNGDKVRYIGIDTPETQHPTLGKECYGPEATARNKELVEGKTVRLERDASNSDRYDRLLRYVWVGDEMINQTLVSEGFAVAHAYPPDTKYQKQFETSELQARQNNIGLWAVCEFEGL